MADTTVEAPAAQADVPSDDREEPSDDHKHASFWWEDIAPDLLAGKTLEDMSPLSAPDAIHDLKHQIRHLVKSVNAVVSLAFQPILGAERPDQSPLSIHDELLRLGREIIAHIESIARIIMRAPPPRRTAWQEVEYNDVVQTLEDVEKTVTEARGALKTIEDLGNHPRLWRIKLLKRARMTFLVAKVMCLPTFPVFSAVLTAIDTLLLPPFLWYTDLTDERVAGLPLLEATQISALRPHVENMLSSVLKLRDALRKQEAGLQAVEIHKYRFDADKLVEDIVKARREADASFRLCETESTEKPEEAFCELIEAVKNIVQELASNEEPDETDILDDAIAALESIDVREVGKRLKDILHSKVLQASDCISCEFV